MSLRSQSFQKRIGVVSALFAVITATQAGAQELKFQGPLKIIAGFPAGGQSDILGRLVADQLKDKLGRPVVVENKTGAGGRIAVETVKNAPADGSQLVLANISHMSLAPLVFADLAYDPVRDFTPITKAVEFQIALTTGKLTAAKSLKDLLEWVKANPAKNSFAIPGSGSLPHLYGIELGKASGIAMQAIAYRGGAPMIPAVKQGEVAMAWAGVADFITQHKAGEMTIVAVTGAKRSPQLPEVQTFTEAGYKTNEPNGWIGFFGPKGMPAALAELYNREIVAALKAPSVVAKLTEFGFIITATTAKEQADQIVSDQIKWKPVVDSAGLGGQKP
jgi:tripartite-type tricarboxylate transporter receptor subunit TctC